MADARLRRLVAARQARGARLRRGARPLPRDPGDPQPARRAAAAPTSPTPSSASTRPTSTSTSRLKLQGRRRQDGPLRQPVDLGLARQARSSKIGRAADLVLCIFPFEPEIYAKHGIDAVYVGHPLASAIPFEVPRAASRAALGVGRRRDRGRAAAGQPPLGDPVHRAAPVRRRRRDAAGRGPGCASSSRSSPGCATRSSRCARSTRADVADRRCSTAARTRRSPPATSPSSPAARRRSRRRCSSGRWSSST